jgi:DNA polymerase III epsilon subunit-like protein
MPHPTCIALDTETGGLDERLHPLLSIAICVADDDFNPLDGFEIKVKPPENTLLEIPHPGYYGLKCVKPNQVSHRINVYTQQVATAPSPVPIITAYAAETNGYVGARAKDGEWDLEAMKTWNANGQDISEAEEDIISYLARWFGPVPPNGIGHIETIAHNAIFDHKFVLYHMPRLFAMLKDPWSCTCVGSRNYYKKKGIKGSAKLIEMAKLAGHNYEGKAHQAFADVEAALAVRRMLKKEGVKVK